VWSRRIVVGLVLIGAAEMVGWYCWKMTRVWKPLDVPISLKRGTVQTHEFVVNVESRYLIGVAVGEEAFFGRTFASPSLRQARWTIRDSRDRLTSGTGESEYLGFGVDRKIGSIIGHATLPTGRCLLEVEGLADSSGLGTISPHLIVLEEGEAYWRVEKEEPSAVLIPMLISGMLLIPYFLLRPILERYAERARAAERRPLTEPGPQTPLAISGPVPANVAECRRFYRRISATVDHAQMRAPFRESFFRLPWASYVIVIVLLFLLVVNQFLWAGKRVPGGLIVRLRRPEIESRPDPLIYPILVHVSHSEKGPAIKVNSRPVAWADLESALRREMMLRPPHWPVYVEGDPDMEWQWAAMTIDVIQGMHLPVILLGRDRRQTK
jgi:hypothetical protein